MAGVQSIERAFALLRELRVRPGGVTALSERVQLPKSTVARLLNALESEGVVEQLGYGGEYRISDGLKELVLDGTGPRNLIAAARPYLTDLTEMTGESSGVNTLADGFVHFVDQIATDSDIQVRDWTGQRGRAHAVPAGIVMLAHAGAKAVDDYLKSGLEALTVNTVTDPSELKERLVWARSAGYAWVYEEFAEGINSVAAPVFGPEGVEAALHVHGPTYRFPNPNRTHDIGLLVVEAANSLSRQLGGEPPA